MNLIKQTRPDIARIPEQAWSFYDPNGVLASSEHPEDALLSWLDSKREAPIALPRIGAVATRQLVATELAHTCTIDSENLEAHSEWLGIPASQVEQGVEAAQAYAYDTARFCLDAITELRHRHQLPLRYTSDVTLAGAVLSANAHKDQWRMNGKPYYSHTKSVALLLNIAHKTHLADHSGSPLPLFDMEALLHDGLEDAFPRDGSSFLTSQNVITSPLVICETLRQLGMPADIAKARAIGILGLTKTVGPDGPMRYWSYIERFSAYPEQIPTKQADLQHNYRIDSKVPLLGNDAYVLRKNQRLFLKKNQYYDAQQHLLAEYSKSDCITGGDWLAKQLFTAHILQLTARDLKQARAVTPWTRLSHNELIAAYEEAADR